MMGQTYQRGGLDFDLVDFDGGGVAVLGSDLEVGSSLGLARWCYRSFHCRLWELTGASAIMFSNRLSSCATSALARSVSCELESGSGGD